MARITYFVVQTFSSAPDGGWIADEPREAENADAARALAAALAWTRMGVVAFSRTGDPDNGEYDDAVEIARFGDLPEHYGSVE